MNTPIQLSEKAVKELNEIITRGNKAEISVHNGKLRIFEIPKLKLRYEVVIATR